MNKELLHFIRWENELIINSGIASFNTLREVLQNLNVPFIVEHPLDYHLEDSPGITSIVLSVEANYLTDQNTLVDIYKMVFFLKDFGLEYVYFFDVKELHYKSKYSKNKPKFIIEEDYIEPNDKSYQYNDKPIHIRDFLNLSPNNSPYNLLKSYSYEIFERIYIDPWHEEKEDWEQSAIDSAYEGDASNCWNTD